MGQFVENTHLLSRQSQAVERFDFSWAIILFATQGRRKTSNHRLWKNSRVFFSKTTSNSTKKTRILIVLITPKHYEKLTRKLDKKCKVSCTLKLPKSFSKNHHFSQNISSFEQFEVASAIITFENHSKRKNPCLVFLKTFKCFLEKKSSPFPNKPEFWTSWQLLSINTIWHAF